MRYVNCKFITSRIPGKLAIIVLDIIKTIVYVVIPD